MSDVPNRVRVCASSELHGDEVRVVPLGLDRWGLPRQALVLRDEDGQVRAYVNQCKHLPIPIDAGTRQFFDDDKRHLLCRTHGAVYRRRDGHCIEGPCEGMRLDPLEVEERNGEVFLVSS